MCLHLHQHIYYIICVHAHDIVTRWPPFLPHTEKIRLPIAHSQKLIMPGNYCVTRKLFHFLWAKFPCAGHTGMMNCDTGSHDKTAHIIALLCLQLMMSEKCLCRQFYYFSSYTLQQAATDLRIRTSKNYYNTHK